MLVVGKPIAFEICTTDISNFELTRITNILKHIGPSWPIFRTKTGNRHVESIDPEFIPHEYTFLTSVIDNLLLVANATITDGSILVPIQLFLCYYESGSDVRCTNIHVDN